MSIAKPPVRSEPAEVFVSYSSRDRDRVVPIVRQLESAGIPVWRDADRLLGGQYYAEKIVEAIKQSKVVLLMGSQAAFQSDNVQRESRITWDHSHRKFVPLMLEKGVEIPTSFIYNLAGVQWIDVSELSPEDILPIVLAALAEVGVCPRSAGPTPSQALPAPTEVAPAKPPIPASGLVAPTAANEQAPSAPVRELPCPAKVEAGAPDSAGRKAEAAKALRFHPGERPIPGVDLQLVEPLGVGGFGEVWKATNPLVPNMQPVALKFCLDPEAQQFLRHEAATIAQVLRHGQRHEGIVSLLHTYLSADPPALEYEYVSGGNLTEYVRSAAPGIGTLPLPLVAKIVRRLAEITAFAHRADPPIVHRDLKPANILVERRVERGNQKLFLRIADFGIGGVASSRIIAQTTGSGRNDNLAAMLQGAHTPLYASPQQIAGQRPDPRDDVHALGVIWYQLLVGDLTCGAPSGRKWADVLMRRGMHPEAIELLNACFESRAEDRPADAGVLLQRLAALKEPRPGDAREARSGTATVPSRGVSETDSDGSVSLGERSEAPGSQAANPSKGPATTRRASDSRKAVGDVGAYPRLDSDGTTLLKCDCGNILKVFFASAGEAYTCQVCGAANTVPDSWTGPREKGEEIPEAIPVDGVLPPVRLKWESLFTQRDQGVPQRGEQRGSGGGLFGIGAWFGGMANQRSSRKSSFPSRFSMIVLAILAVGLLAFGLLYILFGPRGDSSIIK